VQLGALHDRPVGPDPKGMFQVAFAPEHFATVVPG
jgi:DOPA 4,5-dioxygenase